ENTMVTRRVSSQLCAALVLSAVALTFAASRASGAGGLTFTTIDPPGATDTFAQGINDNGQIVGAYSSDDDVTLHGFVLDKGTFHQLDLPGATHTYPWGINAAGQIVGYYEDAAGGFHGFVLDKGTFHTIDVPGALFTVAFGINAAGQIVGDYGAADGTFPGF